jgi:hypothetical protein
MYRKGVFCLPPGGVEPPWAITVKSGSRDSAPDKRLTGANTEEDFMETNAREVARCLVQDLGIAAGIRYAESIVRAGGESASVYQEAKEIMERVVSNGKIIAKVYDDNE